MDKSFLVSSKRLPDSRWAIDSWTTDQEDAIRRAEQLVTAPRMDAAASVDEVGGSATRTPILLPVVVVKRNAKE